MQCQICGAKIAKDEVFTYGDKLLCEDCYIEMISTPKACNPMAVRSARLTREKLGHKGTEGLLPIQKQIYEYIKANKEIPREEAAVHFQLSPPEMEKHFAVLRHCELARAFKKDDTIYVTLMDADE
ncbi:MAG TPA: hypothetical protein GX004_04740 [Firmicutes bacterium]|jgi:hypothetical protein|nr:hypothetical protein [Bacillota bacterium]